MKALVVLRKYLLEKKKIELLIILIIGLCIRIYFATLDPFLHTWDEKFHALVAKNMVISPLKPMLFTKHYRQFDLYGWSDNSVWLHKQPLFLWQIALAFKLFGTSIFNLRLPSIIMGACSIILIYRITHIHTRCKRTSLIASLLICFSNYQCELIAGRFGMDHNDIAFSFYILCSFWAYYEYKNKESIKWLFLIGFFSGCAVLNKWLTGLLVFSGWGLVIIKNFIEFRNYEELKQFAIAIVVCIVTFMPWQLYILFNYTNLALHEYSYNARHINEVIEGHSGSSLFYLNQMNNYFGNFIIIFSFLGIYSQFKNVKKRCNNDIFLLFSIVIVYVFFSFFVKTKLPSYCFIVAPMLIIYISIGVNYLIKQLPLSIKVLIVSLIMFITFDINKVISSRKEDLERTKLIYNTRIYKDLGKYLDSDINCVINANTYENIDIMFFNSNIIAYHWWFSELELENLKKNKIKIGVFKDRGAYTLPNYFKTYPYLKVLDAEIK